jgi:hypothetical protein
MAMPRATMEIAPAVWELLAEMDEPEFALLVAGDASTEREEEVRLAIERAADTVRPTLEPWEGGHVGHFRTVALPIGVAVATSEDSTKLEDFVRAFADELGQAGIGGVLELVSDIQDRDAAPEFRLANLSLLERGHCFECRLRLRGGLTASGGHPRWNASPDVFRAGIDRAMAFVFGEGPSERFMHADFGWYRFDHRDSVLPWVIRAVASTDVLSVKLYGLYQGYYRAAGLNPFRGRISLVEGGRDADVWQEPVGRLREELLEAAENTVYGFVKRGRSPLHAASGSSLLYDWPPFPGSERPERRRHVDLLEDHLLPDVLGIQLLGSSYDGRLPADLPDWHARRVGDATLLEHAQPELWFAHDSPDEDTLRRARVALGPITATDEELKSTFYRMK